jgi:hypothetical protein
MARLGQLKFLGQEPSEFDATAAVEWCSSQPHSNDGSHGSDDVARDAEHEAVALPVGNGRRHVLTCAKRVLHRPLQHRLDGNCSQLTRVHRPAAHGLSIALRIQYADERVSYGGRT